MRNRMNHHIIIFFFFDTTYFSNGQWEQKDKSLLLDNSRFYLLELPYTVIWSHVNMQLWDSGKLFNAKTLRTIWSISLRLVTSGPCRVTNKNLLEDLNTPTITDPSRTYNTTFHSKSKPRFCWAINLCTTLSAEMFPELKNIIV